MTQAIPTLKTVNVSWSGPLDHLLAGPEQQGQYGTLINDGGINTANSLRLLYFHILKPFDAQSSVKRKLKLCLLTVTPRGANRDSREQLECYSPCAAAAYEPEPRAGVDATAADRA